MKMERKQETKAVKKALQAYGINARVGHGTGTAWGWLEINVGSGQQFGTEHVIDERRTHRNCPLCKASNLISAFAEKIAQEVTGRHGDYGGNISCLTQNGWSNKKGTILIAHDLDKLVKAIPELKELLPAA
jgi:hypothetical protein